MHSTAMSAADPGERMMSESGSSGMLPARYAVTPACLIEAEAELDRLTAVHAAYADQPNITSVWKVCPDETADAVTRQRAIVERLRAAIREQFAELGHAAARRL
jgi:hypothetical protein